MEIVGIIGTLIMLIALQVVLGFDNLLYIALESKKAPVEKQEFVRKIGITIAIILRLALLFILVNLVEKFKTPFLNSESEIISFEMNLHSLIILFGGGFILYTSIKEIWHMIIFKVHQEQETKASSKRVIFMIVLMNLVFSFDSILSAYSTHSFLWKVEKKQAIPINYNPLQRPNKQEIKNRFIENGAIYATTLKAFQKKVMKKD